LFTRRCIVPATGFYEWAAAGKPKTPMHFRLKSGEIFGFAALWDRRGGTVLRFAEPFVAESHK